jgi:NADH dehydrogenase
MTRVFITGGTGFVGRHIIKRALDEGYKIVALVRSEKKAGQVLGDRKELEFVSGSIADGTVMEKGMKSCDAVIHLVGIIYESRKKGATFEKVHFQGTLNVLDSVKKSGVKRYLHMSALGARPSGRARYQKSKWAAEEAVRKTSLDWTIFRPTVIFGPEDDFINRFEKMSRTLPFVPVVGDGKNKFQPIWVEDVASCYVNALDNPKTIGKAYGLAGPKIYTFEELIKTILKVKGRRRLIIKMPMKLARFNAKILEKILDPPPLSIDQLIMLEDDNVCSKEMLCDMKSMLDTFDFEHRRLEDVVKDYL